MTFLRNGSPVSTSTLLLPPAPVPLQGTVLLAHKEVARLLVGGKTPSSKTAHSLSQRENKSLKKKVDRDRWGRMFKMTDVLSQLKHFKKWGRQRQPQLDLDSERRGEYLLACQPTVQVSVTLSPPASAGS